nr:peptidylprolyl isomerase [Enterococcus faecium]
MKRKSITKKQPSTQKGTANNTTTKKPSTESSKSTSTAESTTTSNAKMNALELPQRTKKGTQKKDPNEMVTNKGTIKIKLFPEYAPKAVENFMTHAKDGYYNGKKDQKRTKDFMIQGGDPKGERKTAQSIWGEGFETEINNHLYNIRHPKPIHHAKHKKTNNSNHSINQKTDESQQHPGKDDYPQAIIDAYKNGGYPSLDGHYTVFGQVIEGTKAENNIKNIETDSSDKPKEEVKIDKINILQEAKQK